MRVAVYTMTRHIENVTDLDGWLADTQDADLRLVLNCGYTDTEQYASNMAKLKNAHVVAINGSVSPWRIDDALNAVITLIPHHYEIGMRIDLDERPRPGWRTVIDRTWRDDMTLLSHVYHWTPALSLHGERVHARNGFRWRGSCNERLLYYGAGAVNSAFAPGLVIDRHAPEQFLQESDIAMLARDANDWPNDAVIALTHARELAAAGMHSTATEELQRYLRLAGDKGIRSAYAFRLLSQADPGNAQDYFLKAEAAYSCASNQLVMAEYYAKNKMYRLCYTSAQFAIMLERSKPLKYVADWTDDVRLTGPMLHELAATSAFALLDYEAAYGHAVEALRRAPGNTRLKIFLDNVQRKIQAGATLEPDLRLPSPPVITVEHRHGGARGS